MSDRQLVRIAMLVAFSEDKYFTQTYDANLDAYDDWDLVMHYNDGGCNTVIRVKSDVDQLAYFFDECDEYFDNGKMSGPLHWKTSD